MWPEVRSLPFEVPVIHISRDSSGISQTPNVDISIKSSSTWRVMSKSEVKMSSSERAQSRSDSQERRCAGVEATSKVEEVDTKPEERSEFEVKLERETKDEVKLSNVRDHICDTEPSR
jgi:hypothetical protein